MATTSNRSINIRNAAPTSPGVVSNNTYHAAENTAGPGVTEVKTFTTGFNLITPPTGGKTPKACTIIPPAGNAVSMLLKKVTGDTGIGLHLTDPSSIALADPAGTFGITTGADLVGLTLVWS